MTPEQIADFLIYHPAEWGNSAAKKQFQRLDREERFEVLKLTRERYGKLLRSDADFPPPPQNSLSQWLMSEAL